MPDPAGKRDRRGLRPPPAYPRYAADSQTAPEYELPLEVRGLKASMMDGQWLSVDDSVPIDPVALALLIRRPVEEVRRALPLLLALQLDDMDTTVPGRLTFLSLRAYKAKIGAISQKRAEAGAEGNAEKKRLKAVRDAANATALADANANPSANANAISNGNASLTSTSTSTPSLGGVDPNEPFLKELTRGEEEERERRAQERGRLTAVAGGRE